MPQDQLTTETERLDEVYCHIRCELLQYVLTSPPPDWLIAWAKSLYTLYPPNSKTAFEYWSILPRAIKRKPMKIQMRSKTRAGSRSGLPRKRRAS